MSHRFLIASVLVFAASLQAQVSGRMSGRVVDPSGAAIAGANVKLVLADGAAAVVRATTNAEGLFFLSAIRPENYDLVIEAPGFRKESIRQIKVNPQQETSLGAIKLELGAVTEVVEVQGSANIVQTSNAEVSSVITNEQLRRLPAINRSPLAMLYTQAGISTNNRSSTTINGLRPSFVNITLDGINIQDNFTRTNTLDFQPNMLLLDQIAEINVGTSNNNVGLGGGSAQINFITPSGTNKFHGAAIWSNRNNALAANPWFNNRDGVRAPFLNQNQFGGSIGGPIKKDKLFFYVNYEGIRLRQQSLANRTILSNDARNGIFTYVAGGVVRKVNVLQAAGVAIDSAAKALLDQVPGADRINNFRTGDSSEALLRNTAGYSFNIRNNRTRENVTGKSDWYLTPRHSIAGTFIWNKDIVDRSDLANDYSTAPKVSNDSSPRLFSVAWRWTPTATTTNELRGGANLTVAPFATSEKFPNALVGGLLYSNPINTFRAQGRETNTYNLLDNATTVKGKHTLQYGFQFQRMYVAPYNDAGITPTYTLGISPTNPLGLNSNQLPGISAADLGAANALLANLAGLVSAYTQTFNITSRDSGFVSGAAERREFLQSNWALYLQDTWKARRRLSANFGVRFDYFSILDEKNSLVLQPRDLGGNGITALLGNPTYDFAGKAAGRPIYNTDKNNFAPSIGFAWDVFGNGKTAVRGGYSINFVNDENIVAIRNNLNTNNGLTASPTVTNLVARLSNLPAVRPAVYKVPRTPADNFALNVQNAQGVVDPNLRTPYVQQYSFGIQQDIKGSILEIRYVGNHGVKQFRAFDYNQVNIAVPGFLDDFRRAYNNGILAQAANRGFDPAFNAAIAGSQPTPFFNRLPSGGLLNNATIRGLIQTNQIADLATTYQVNGLNGDVNFFPSPYGLGMNLFTNYSHSSYNGLQADLRRRFRNGLQLQSNYTYAKVMSDAAGDGQARFEAFLDINNGKIERARVPFDVTHIIRANGVYELPFGKGHSWNPSNAVASRIVSGWNLGSVMVWQSGTPFSVLSGRGTFNRAARAGGTNTAITALNKSQLDEIIGFRQTGSGPYIVAASAIGPDGRGVNADGAAAFQGQVFFQPGAAQIGTLQRRYFSGPWNFAYDLSVQKVTQIRESHSIELRIDAQNVFNHPTFDVGGDHTLTSTQFGRITGTGFAGRRLVQLTGTYRF